MRLLSDQMLQELPTYIQVQGMPQEELILHHHLYNPVGLGDWFVIAKDFVEGDVELFVIEVLEEPVLRRRGLKEIGDLKLYCGQRIKRDRSFRRMSLEELRGNLHIIL